MSIEGQYFLDMLDEQRSKLTTQDFIQMLKDEIRFIQKQKLACTVRIYELRKMLDEDLSNDKKA